MCFGDRESGRAVYHAFNAVTKLVISFSEAQSAPSTLITWNLHAKLDRITEKAPRALKLSPYLMGTRMRFKGYLTQNSPYHSGSCSGSGMGVFGGSRNSGSFMRWYELTLSTCQACVWGCRAGPELPYLIQQKRHHAVKSLARRTLSSPTDAGELKSSRSYARTAAWSV